MCHDSGEETGMDAIGWEKSLICIGREKNKERGKVVRFMRKRIKSKYVRNKKATLIMTPKIYCLLVLGRNLDYI